MKYLKKLKSFLAAKYEDYEIAKQKDVAAFIFDSILEKRPIEDIMNEIKIPISKPLKAILLAIQEIGYIDTIKSLEKEPTISVVIPHYNHYEYLSQALLYLSKQTSLPEEVIVVDDGSDDVNRVKEIVGSFGHVFPVMVVERPPRLDRTKGRGDSRQLGAENASSDVVVMHDADDLSHKDRIKVTREFFKKFPHALHVNVGQIRFDKTLRDGESFGNREIDSCLKGKDSIAHQLRRLFVGQNLLSFYQNRYREGSYGCVEVSNYGCHSGHVAYRRVLSSIVKWDQGIFTFFEDYEFNMMLFFVGQRSYYLDLPLIFYRDKSSSSVWYKGIHISEYNKVGKKNSKRVLS